LYDYIGIEKIYTCLARILPHLTFANWFESFFQKRKEFFTMFNNSNDFVHNRQDPTAIVYQSVTGPIRLTKESFSSEAEFQKWKRWSDRDYADTEQTGRSYNDNCVLFLENLLSTGASIEDLLVTALPDGTKGEQKKALLRQIRTCMTETQYRRFCLFYADGLSIPEIAQQEGISRQGISESLTAAWKKIRKLFVNNL